MRIVVVGSGASGVHFARSLLDFGHEVTMVDVGHQGPAPVLPDADFAALKERLDDSAGYLLGEWLQGVVWPDVTAEVYGFPPSKDYVFRSVPGPSLRLEGFEPLQSFARGGLAEAWTGGCYPFVDADLIGFPFGRAELTPHYAEVARRIGVTGAPDDLARFLPLHEHLLPPLDLDEHSAWLLARYAKRRERLNRQGVWLGRTRVATLSRPLAGREPCRYLGRCLWGCPHGALYTPAATLVECLAHPRFTYVGGHEALYLRVDADRRVTAVVARSLGGERVDDIAGERFALAAGTLATAKLVLRTAYEATGEVARLDGLMDNRQVLVPFVTLRLVGRPWRPDRYQYHLLGLGLETPDAHGYVHGQLTTLNAALVHPIAQRLPLDLRSALTITRLAHAGLGVVNLNFHDTRRAGNTVSLEPVPGGEPRFAVRYAPPDDEPIRLADALDRLTRALRLLGSFVPPGMAHRRPMGASVHYAGTLPMQESPGRWTTGPDGQSRDYANLWIVDGSTFPALPAKNLTFTLMANAVRIAARAFRA